MSGAEGSNECPAGSARIQTEAACRIAAVAVGKTVGTPDFVGTYSYYPRGCYLWGVPSYSYAWLNSHPVGAGNSAARLLCTAATTGAPLRAPMYKYLFIYLFLCNICLYIYIYIETDI